MRNSTSFVPVTWLQVFRFENSLYIDVEFHPVYRRKKRSAKRRWKTTQDVPEPPST